jgi:hypothetical protein
MPHLSPSGFLSAFSPSWQSRTSFQCSKNPKGGDPGPPTNPDMGKSRQRGKGQSTGNPGLPIRLQHPKCDSCSPKLHLVPYKTLFMEYPT